MLLANWIACSSAWASACNAQHAETAAVLKATNSLARVIMNPTPPAQLFIQHGEEYGTRPGHQGHQGCGRCGMKEITEPEIQDGGDTGKRNSVRNFSGLNTVEIVVRI